MSKTPERDEVQRVHSHLSEDQIDTLISLRVPELMFDFGAGLRMTSGAHDKAMEYSESIAEEIKDAIKGNPNWKPFSSKGKGRNYRRNRITSRFDSILASASSTPKAYWTSVLSKNALQKGGSIKKIIAYLATIIPDSQPSEGQLYTTVKKQLEAIAQIREDNNYKPPTTKLDLPRKEAVEALRLFGSAEHGFGTLPNMIEYLLTRTGLIFLALPDDVAKVPEYWLDYYRNTSTSTAPETATPTAADDVIEIADSTEYEGDDAFDNAFDVFEEEIPQTQRKRNLTRNIPSQGWNKDLVVYRGPNVVAMQLNNCQGKDAPEPNPLPTALIADIQHYMLKYIGDEDAINLNFQLLQNKASTAKNIVNMNITSYMTREALQEDVDDIGGTTDSILDLPVNKIDRHSARSLDMIDQLQEQVDAIGVQIEDLFESGKEAMVKCVAAGIDKAMSSTRFAESVGANLQAAITAGIKDAFKKHPMTPTGHKPPEALQTTGTGSGSASASRKRTMINLTDDPSPSEQAQRRKKPRLQMLVDVKEDNRIQLEDSPPAIPQFVKDTLEREVRTPKKR
ncbi:hypothetical protein F5B21DRAFT_224471 [Xylaria acuta]|nr:hypothetical protein F5B21DRAFT_224471 [Xylaria acuta]